jgi:hypothetical protein
MEAGCAIFREPFAMAIFNGIWKRPLLAEFEPHACASAQWIFYAGAQLFEMCEKNSGLRRDVWLEWRKKFERITGSAQLSNRCRQTALQAVHRMAKIEEEGVTTNIVSEREMSYRDGDTIVSNWPESRAYVGKKAQWNKYAEDGED